MFLILVNTLGFSILIPVLPFIVRDNNHGDFVYGILISAYSGFQFIGSPLLGKLSDRYGRKIILVISQAGTLFSWFIVAGAWYVDQQYSGDLALIIIGVGRILDGITGGNNSVVGAYLADIMPKEKRQFSYGILGAVMGLGMIIGPAIGAYTSSGEIGYLGMVLFCIILSLITLLVIIFLFKESIQEKNMEVPPIKKILFERIFFWRSFKPFRNNEMIKIGLWVRTFTSTAMAGYTTVIALLLIDQFSLTITEVGNFLFFVGGFMIFNQLMIRYFNRLIGEKNILWLGLFLMGLGLYIFPATDHLGWFIFFYYLTNLGMSLNFPTIKTVLANNISVKQQGEISGLDESLQSLAMAIIPALAGLSYQYFAWKSFWIPASIATLGSIFVASKLGKAYRSKTENPI